MANKYLLGCLLKKVHYSWSPLMVRQLSQPYMASLEQRLDDRRREGAVILPPAEDVFRAFCMLPLDKVNVVILGQDPYHGIGQAHGLAFSVLPGVKVPPSLRNIYRELEQDVGCAIPVDGCLDRWLEQGVLLLNNVLTVEQGQAGSHKNLGWELFTDSIISEINRRCRGVVFLLWGGAAQKKACQVDRSKHCVLQAPHPSPLSSYRGFFGCKHFSSANHYLVSQGKKAIDWQIGD